MDIKKEGLLFAGTTLISVGAAYLQTDFIKGIIGMILGCGILIGRGFYKKYFPNE